VVLAAWSRPADPVVHQEMMMQSWQRTKGVWALTEQTPLQTPQADAKAVSPTDAL
jgi:hypothetical protein